MRARGVFHLKNMASSLKNYMNIVFYENFPEIQNHQIVLVKKIAITSFIVKDAAKSGKEVFNVKCYKFFFVRLKLSTLPSQPDVKKSHNFFKMKLHKSGISILIQPARELENVFHHSVPPQLLHPNNINNVVLEVQRE